MFRQIRNVNKDISYKNKTLIFIYLSFSSVSFLCTYLRHVIGNRANYVQRKNIPWQT